MRTLIRNGTIVNADATSRADLLVDGERIDWAKGDLLMLPLRPNGVEHQHFNSDIGGKPALWMAFIHQGMREYLSSEMTQTVPSPEFQAMQDGRGS